MDCSVLCSNTGRKEKNKTFKKLQYVFLVSIYVTPSLINKIDHKQGFCILLATILRTLGQVKENSHEYEDEYAEPSTPLLRPPEMPPNSPLYSYVIGEPVHIEPHSFYKIV